MKRFGGFPPKMRFTAVPEPFFSHLLSEIDDISELKVILFIFHLLYNKKGYPKYITFRELLADPGLIAGLNAGTGQMGDIIEKTLVQSEKQGIILRVAANTADTENTIILLNTESDREVMLRIRNGELSLPDLKVVTTKSVISTERLPDIFTIYEENIGMITPMIAEEIRQAKQDYPESWLQEAIREAANQNKRKWSYISAILERWSSEGKAGGTYRRDIKKTDPDKYIKGKYGHMVQR